MTWLQDLQWEAAGLGRLALAALFGGMLGWPSRKHPTTEGKSP